MRKSSVIVLGAIVAGAVALGGVAVPLTNHSEILCQLSHHSAGL